MRIYEPEEDSYLLQESVEKLAHGRVLDMGTGSGIQAMAAGLKKEVREVVAVDINRDAVHSLKKKKLAKVKSQYSDLFSKVSGRFDVIIFNPPYLPEEFQDPDVALDGGKVGYETIERFLKVARNFLEKKGFILMVFSNRTKKETIDRIAAENYSIELISKKPLPFFEELYVYRLADKYPGLLMRGKRGLVHKKGKVCIKEKNPESKVDTLANEAMFLKILNKKKIGPKFIRFEDGKLYREFVEGMALDDFLDNANTLELKKMLLDVLHQCFVMDSLGINKFEMNNPYKHIIIASGSKPVLIDFERCRRTASPKNVTQFLQYVLRKRIELSAKGIAIKKETIMDLGKRYKENPGSESFNNITRMFL